MERQEVIEVVKLWLKDELPELDVENMHVCIRPSRDIESRAEEEDQTEHNGN